MFSVQLPGAVIEDGLQLASMPEGIPLSISPTVPVKPLLADVVIVKLVLLPAVIVCELGEAEMEKSALVVELDTTSVKYALLVRLVLVPVRPIVYVPVAAELEAVMVSVGSPDPLTVVELRFPLTPLGSPVTVSVTGALKPPWADTVAVRLVFPPCFTEVELGLIAMEKLAVWFDWLELPLENPAQPVRASNQPSAAAEETNLGEFIGYVSRSQAKSISVA